MPMDQRLFVAAKKGNMEVVEEYKDQFATQLTPYNNTLLHVAALYAPLSWKINPIDFLAMVGPDLLFRLNSNGDTFIHLAAKRGQRHLIQACINYMKSCGGLGIIDIEAGIKKARELLRITNNDGNTALHLAAMHYHCRDTVEVLVKEDADFSYPPNNGGKAPLYLAAEIGDKYSVGFMLDNCSSPSYSGPYGSTALHAAVMYGATECTEMILGREPSLIKQVDDFGWNPLHYAAYLGYKRMARILLRADNQMAYDVTKEENKTPLHLAAQNNKLEVVEEILEQCPDSLEVVSSQGQNALHVAYANGHQGLMHLIRQYGLISGIIDMKDADGNTPEDAKGKSVLSHPCLAELLHRKSTARKRSNIHYYYDAKDKERDKKIYKDRIEQWKGRANTHLIVATLIITVSFAAGFTVPGGYDGDNGQNKGMAILGKKAAFKAFAITDTIAMISSTSSVFLLYLSSYEQRLRRYEAAGSLVMVAMIAMMIAFMTGLYIVLPSATLGVFICVICSLSLAVLIFIFGKNLKNYWNLAS